MSACQPSAVITEDTAVERCDVCIVGAGIAGLNALFVASRYLSRDQRVILIDRRKRVGGMWVDTYPYVRLHQPYGLFTAGNIKWTLGEDRSYLATRGEVLNHLEYCLNTIKQQVQVDEFFGWATESDDEADGIVRITCRSSDGRLMVVEAKRLIKASGFEVRPNDPLETSSKRVRSVSPNFCDMRSDDMRASDRPVWIIGGGKTAMDTAHALITEYPGREVNLLAGSGTFFLNRDRCYPAGARRWWGGTALSRAAVEAARRFDGTNETVVGNWFRGRYGTWPTPEAGKCMLGVLSQSENTTIAAGLNEVIMDHFVDAVDREGATDLMLRSGSTKAIQPGSWLVNCTGYFKARGPYVPYVSPSGAVLTIQMHSATMHLSSVMAYFLTHLLFSGKITDVPLYELDALDLMAKSKAAFPYALFSLAQHNISLITEHLPTKVFQDYGVNSDRWYPLPRRLFFVARARLTHRRDREHCRRSLDTIRDRFDVRCGPLAHTPPLIPPTTAGWSTGSPLVGRITT